MASSDSQMDKPQCGRPKRAELLDVNINTGVQSIDTERVSLSPNSDPKKSFLKLQHEQLWKYIMEKCAGRAGLKCITL